MMHQRSLRFLDPIGEDLVSLGSALGNRLNLVLRGLESGMGNSTGRNKYMDLGGSWTK